jgi:hypothetical protein
LQGAREAACRVKALPASPSPATAHEHKLSMVAVLKRRRRERIGADPAAAGEAEAQELCGPALQARPERWGRFLIQVAYPRGAILPTFKLFSASLINSWGSASLHPRLLSARAFGALDLRHIKQMLMRGCRIGLPCAFLTEPCDKRA